MQKKNKEFKTWVEVSRKNILHNFEVMEKLVGKDVLVASVLKANAYGHGLSEVVSILGSKVKFISVDNASEALVVREANKKVGILVLGYCLSQEILILVNKGISFVVPDIETLKIISGLNLSKPAKIHLKIETGLGRLGFNIDTLSESLSFLKKISAKVILEGIYTHLSNVEDTEDPSYTFYQLNNFRNALDLIEKKGFKSKYIHTAASAAAMIYPESRFSIIRMGIGLYGLWPSEGNKKAIVKKYNKIILKPAMTWKTLIAQVKEVEKSSSVGYGREWLAKKKSRIAVIPVGYSDGYDRKLTNAGRVIIRGKSAHVVGRIAMNMFMVDVSAIKEVKKGDEVILLGGSSKKFISADEIAAKIGTINYEVVCRVSPNIPRIIV